VHERELNDRVSLRVLDGDPARAAVLVPGFLGGCFQPLLNYATLVLLARGWQVTQVEWRPLRDDDWVRAQVEATLETVDAERPLLVGKSLATRAAPVAAERGLPAIWLTPLLDEPSVVAGLEQATAPTLLVGGTGDASWNPRLAATLPAELLELPGADHGLEVDDPFASLDLLRRVAERIDAFVAAL